MNELVRFLLIGIVIFCAHTLEGITGFGCTVIALPFITMLLGIRMTVPLLCLFGWFMALYILCRSWRSIQWKEFLFIVLCVGLGMPVGMFLYDKLPERILCLILAVFMVGVGGSGTYKTWKNQSVSNEKVKKNSLMSLILFCGGIIHGSFGTGGPFVVIYAAKALPEKSLFRVTLSMLWFSLNTLRLVDWTVRGSTWTPEIGKAFLWASPFLVSGILFGDYLHHRVNERIFRLCVYSVLCIAGLVMLGANLF